MEKLKNKRFGRLFVIDECVKKHKRRCMCLCDCGNIKEIRAENLLRGRTKSCGCYAADRAREIHTKHGSFKTRLYHIWDGIKKRCRTTSKNKYYSGKGVKLCKDWNDFENFKMWSLENGYKDNLTIDRIDYNGDYCPENCRWATYKQQARNKSSNRIIQYKGKNMCASEVAEILGINQSTFFGRLDGNKKYLFSKCNNGKKYITYNGDSLSIMDWVRKLGINKSSFYYHIRRGKSAEDTIRYFYSKLMHNGKL